MFWETPGVWTDRGRLRRRVHAEPDLRGGLLRPHRPRRGRAGRVRPRRRSATSSCSRCSGRTTTRPRACARATTSGTQYRSRHLLRRRGAAARRPRPAEAMFQEQLAAAGYGDDHDRDRPGRRLLLRRALPPAVPGQEPGRLLRSGRHGRELPDRRRQGRLRPSRRRPAARDAPVAAKSAAIAPLTARSDAQPRSGRGGRARSTPAVAAHGVAVGVEARGRPSAGGRASPTAGRSSPCIGTPSTSTIAPRAATCGSARDVGHVHHRARWPPRPPSNAAITSSTGRAAHPGRHQRVELVAVLDPAGEGREARVVAHAEQPQHPRGHRVR